MNDTQNASDYWLASRVAGCDFTLRYRQAQLNSDVLPNCCKYCGVVTSTNYEVKNDIQFS